MPEPATGSHAYCTCNGEDTIYCDIHVTCDEHCQALLDPHTHEQVLAAYRHWRSHGHLAGCSHAR